jgi:hypothetical protein
MTDTSYTPRIRDLDVPFAAGRLQSFVEARAKAEDSLRANASKSPQASYAAIYLDCRYIAFYEFGLGYPVEKIRQSCAEAAHAALHVFELRGTMECRVDRPGTKDYSLTNSHDCFETICMAMIAGEYELADKLAELMADPPDAEYIGPRSEVCTNNQQHLAYAVKHLFRNDPDGIDQELRRIWTRKGEQQVGAVGKMVRGLAEKNDTLFGEGLLELLFFHRKAARLEDGPQRFFSLAAVGLSVLAVQRGLLRKADLPPDDCLPLELIPANP